MTRTVAVVVPTKDRRDVLVATLRTVLAQEEVTVRVVVVDDGSSDGSAEAAAALDGRITVVRNEVPRGAAAARNASLVAVDTPWVAFCDDDDLWAPDKLTRQLDAIAGTPGARWCCSGAVCVEGGDLRIIDDQRPPDAGDVLPTLLVRNRIPGGGSAVLADTALLREVGGFAEDLVASEDWDLWIRLAARSPLAVVDEPLVGYRIWPGGKSRQVARMEQAFDQIAARHADLAARCGVTPDRAGHQRFLAKQALRAGDRRAAARRFLGARHPERALLALLAPSAMERLGTRRMRDRVPSAWEAGAERWLAPLRREIASTRAS